MPKYIMSSFYKTGLTLIEMKLNQMRSFQMANRFLFYHFRHYLFPIKRNMEG